MRFLPGLCALLIAWAAPQAARATNRYVSAPTNLPAGNDANPGTLAQPYATLQRAADVAQPGDTVLVRGGTYTNPCAQCQVVVISRGGTPSQWITFRNYPGEQPLLRFNGWGGFSLRPGAAYIEIRGFRVQGAVSTVTVAAAQVQNQSCNPDGTIRPGSFEPIYNGNGIEADGRSASGSQVRPHHLRFVRNEVFECGGGGIGAIQCDYVTIEDNLVYNNCWTSLFGNSGISLYQSWNFDTAPGYHMLVRNNRCFGNRLYVKWIGMCEITDGNGIIIDDTRNTQNGSALGAYQSRTLIANNVVVNNGGSGIHAYSSDHVDIVNNTAYQNSQSPEIDGGEIFGNSASDLFIANNILVASAGNRLNTAYSNTGVAYRNNLFFGGTTAAVLGQNAVQADPRFVAPSLNPATANFRLLASSPAINAGTATAAPGTDLTGATRPVGAGYDLGAYEYAGPLPVELLRFTAQRQGPAAVLLWATASETRNAGFGVEASADGRTFRRIGWVAGRGSGSAPIAYTFRDPGLLAYATATVYYRLRQTDTDGSFRFSPVQAVSCEGSGQEALHLAPNPAGPGSRAVLTGPANAVVHVVDALGRVVWQGRTGPAGSAELPVPAGLYVVRCAGRTVRLQQE
ncbi:hypothetical protein GCM10023185_02390 [Hymenobacter saemangeumensis]|uniref:DUF1565 domain-containing protein n=1 Tax=Hymenobacter saemangeumensis TaxID=1084522 RepID=A0ABP8HYC6_9BACT